MREATGELNLLFIIILLVGALIAFFYLAIWPMIDHSQEQQLKCKQAICSPNPDDKGMVTCRTNEGIEITCKYKG